MNEHQKSRFAKQIYDVMNGTLAGKRIVLFGFAFKKNTEGTSTR
jgi:UDPglucose 6-dehydrogenase